MISEWHPMGRALILFGAILMGVGLFLLLAPKLPWLGRLPGDLVIHRDHFSLYVPLTSSLVASAGLTVVLWLIARFHR